MVELAVIALAVVLVGYVVVNEHRHQQWTNRVDAILSQPIVARHEHETVTTQLPDMVPPASTIDPTMQRMIDRLLDVALPAREEPREDEVIENRSDAEYEPPTQPVMDWSDPFIGLPERDVVGGLAPGQAIPGIGDAFGEGIASGLDGVSGAAADMLFGTWDQTTARATDGVGDNGG